MIFRITILFLAFLLSAPRLEVANEVVAERSENVEIVVNELIQSEDVRVARVPSILRNERTFYIRPTGKAQIEFPSIAKSDLVIRLRRILI